MQFIVRTTLNAQIHSVGRMQFLYAKAGATYSEHWALKGS
jgi:hypothetical protein